MTKLSFRLCCALLALWPALPIAAEESGIPVESTRKFVDIIEKIKQSYVSEVSDDVLFEYAIRGMMSGLDPHSSYLDNSENDELQIRTRGEFGGLGIQITLSEEGFVRVISPIDDTPAARAGMQPQDLIIKLDGKPVQGKTLEQVLDIMRGKPGTKITLTVAREGSSLFDLTITRDIIRIRSVRATMLSTGYGYLRISSFQANTGSDLREAFDKLKQQATKMSGLVLDLRNNPGGLLPSAIEVTDFFLADGSLVVYTEGRAPGSNQKFFTENDDYTNSTPLVVLVNGGSASASEIVAGALQDQKRAVVLGTKSFGKGSVQTIIPLADKNAIKLTTARFFSPGGRSIQAEGITPDIEVQPGEAPLPEGEKAAESISEADLDRHLENATPGKQAEKQAAITKELRDLQVREAYNLLKAVNIYSLK